MTVEQLIEQLSKHPKDLLVVISASEDSYTPMVFKRKHNFDHMIWESSKAKFINIPANTEFIEL